jgi:hypothetical protein
LHSYRGWEVQDKVPAGLVSGKGLVSASKMNLGYLTFTWLKAKGQKLSKFYEKLLLEGSNSIHESGNFIT